MKKILISTTPYVDTPIKKYIGVINANEVFGIGELSELFAAFSDGWGGRSGKFRNQMNEIYKVVVDELTEKAFKLGANAIVGLSVDINEISGKGKQMFMACAMGTAVVVDREDIQNENTSKEDTISINSIDCESLDFELSRDKTLSTLHRNTAKQSWDKLLARTDKETAKIVIEKLSQDARFFENGIDERFVERVTEYMDTLSCEDASDAIYPVLENKEYQKSALTVIQNAKLFDPMKILEIAKDPNHDDELMFNLINSPKREYTHEDLRIMKDIFNCFDMSIKGTVEEKKGLLLGPKNIFTCPEGHTSSGLWDQEHIDNCVCEKCGKNAYGYKPKHYDILKTFEKKIEMLEKLLG